MKKIISITSILIFFLFNNIYPQELTTQLAEKVYLTKGDLLKLKLQILSSQITCGSYIIIDMGRLRYPVSIILENDVIVFNIEGKIDKKLSDAVKADIMKEGMEFVYIAISKLIREEFPDLIFDNKKNIIGNWYYVMGHLCHARWENGDISILNQQY